MYQIDDWREVIKLPVIGTVNPEWTLEELEKILTNSVRNCAEFCLEKNWGEIHLSLSGGIDSTLALAIIRKLFPKVMIHSYTIVSDMDHPDIYYARLAEEKFDAVGYLAYPTVSKEALGENVLEFEKIFPEHSFRYRSGDIAVFMLLRRINYCTVHRWKEESKNKAYVIASDGADEIMGGYKEHRFKKTSKAIERAFDQGWRAIAKKHLIPLERSANHFEIVPVFPYLQREFVEYSARIPVSDRTSREKSKILIRQIARNFGVPEEIIARPKVGFCDALTPTTAFEAKLAERR